MKYLEYDITTGRILSELTTDIEPEASDGIGLIPIDDETEIDMSMFMVKDGRLLKTVETEGEKSERERIRREHEERLRVRLNSMCREAVIAILADDKEELSNLRQEYRKMKNSL